MKQTIAAGVMACACLGALLASAALLAAPASPGSWDARAAGKYLDGRADWWMGWPNARRDHDTFCVSCHTALPYAIARPALRSALAESGPSTTERRLFENVVKRVGMWKDVEPFYPDQTRGLPKTSESRGTEAILNALILASRDARTGRLADETRTAFDNLWALQFKAGEQAGAWAWLNFHYEPWESGDAPYFGAALAAVAVGTAPDHYASTTDLKDRLNALREYLRRTRDTQHTFNRIMLLWASSNWPGLLSPDERQGVIDAVVAKQQADGGWSMASLAPWKRQDGSAQETASDGYATGLITFVLQDVDRSLARSSVSRGLTWLTQHQDPTSGGWQASSLNKRRDPASDAGRFMSDAATAFAVLALTGGQDTSH